VTTRRRMQEKCVFVFDRLFAARDLPAADVSNSRS
jgi:hypothetical protein